MVNRITTRHKTVPDKDEALRIRMRELAEQRKSFGAPRLHVLLKQEGLVVNHKRTERIYREEKLSLRKRKKKHQAISSRKPDDTVAGLRECLAMDFVHDNLADGRTYLEYDRFVGSFLSDSGSRFFPNRPGCGECTKPACRAGPHAAHVARGQRP